MKNIKKHFVRVLLSIAMIQAITMAFNINLIDRTETNAQIIGPIIRACLAVGERLTPLCRTWVGRCVLGAGATAGACCIWNGIDDVWHRHDHSDQPDVSCSEWAESCMANAKCATAGQGPAAYQTSLCDCMGGRPDCSALGEALGCGGEEEQAGN